MFNIKGYFQESEKHNLQNGRKYLQNHVWYPKYIKTLTTQQNGKQLKDEQSN